MHLLTSVLDYRRNKIQNTTVYAVDIDCRKGKIRLRVGTGNK